MYIDPSVGGQLFAILAVAFTAISGTVLIFAGRIKMFFARKRRDTDEMVETAAEDKSDD